jgi:hypothetical protein
LTHQKQVLIQSTISFYFVSIYQFHEIW